MFELAIGRACTGDEPTLRVAIRELETMPADAVDAAIEACLLEVPAVLWANGWQPPELVRHLRRVPGPSPAAWRPPWCPPTTSGAAVRVCTVAGRSSSTGARGAAAAHRARLNLADLAEPSGA